MIVLLQQHEVEELGLEPAEAHVHEAPAHGRSNALDLGAVHLGVVCVQITNSGWPPANCCAMKIW